MQKRDPNFKTKGRVICCCDLNRECCHDETMKFKIKFKDNNKHEYGTKVLFSFLESGELHNFEEETPKMTITRFNQ